MIGFGATAKGYFHACALRHFWGFSLSAAVVEVAVALCMHRTFAQSAWVRACIPSYSVGSLQKQRLELQPAMLKMFVCIPVGGIPNGTTLTERKAN